MTAPQTALSPGAQVGPYRLEALLGAGGMGVVYKARAEADGSAVALKILHRHHIANPQVTRRFAREAALLRRLTGEHLVPLVDFGEDDDGRLYMALAFVDGDPLDLWLEQKGAPPVRRAVEWTMAVCTALDCCHREGVIHRDLKPANILLEKLGPRPGEGAAEGEGDARRVRVCDFGLGKALQEPGVATTALTDQNMIFGTPEYMSPEQVRGDELDERCDVYAAGVVLYELLAGKPPFRAMTSVLTMTAHLAEQPPPPSAAAPQRGVSPALDAVVMHALAKQPADRYPSATALRRALASALSAPLDIDAVHPGAELRSSPDLGQRDTDLALHATLPSSRPPALVRAAAVDPLGSTVEIKGFDASKLPLPPSPAVATSPTPPPRRAATITPEAIERADGSRERPWVWLAVALVAAAVGIGVGLLTAR